MKILSPKYIIAIAIATLKIPTIIFFTRLLVVSTSFDAVLISDLEEMELFLLWTVITDSYLQFTKSLNSWLNSIYVALGNCFCNLFNLYFKANLPTITTTSQSLWYSYREPNAWSQLCIYWTKYWLIPVITTYLPSKNLSKPQVNETIAIRFPQCWRTAVSQDSSWSVAAVFVVSISQ